MGNFIAIMGICISGLYLFSKIKYFKNNYEGIKKKKVQNIVDFILAVCIFGLSFTHLKGVINEVKTGVPSNSYTTYIILCFAIYFIWIKINVSKYRKNLK